MCFVNILINTVAAAAAAAVLEESCFRRDLCWIIFHTFERAAIRRPLAHIFDLFVLLTTD